jgi:hypothetical protein
LAEAKSMSAKYTVADLVKELTWKESRFIGRTRSLFQQQNWGETMNFSSLFSKESAFTRYFLAFIIWELASWALPVAVPLLVAEKYGIGAELAFIIGMQWLPSIFFRAFYRGFDQSNRSTKNNDLHHGKF